MVEFLKTKANQIVSVNETTAKMIMRTVTEMTAEGDTSADIASVIRDVFNLRSTQATLIGRQEVGSALNAGRFGQMKEDGVERHEWVWSQVSREDHAEIDGTIVDIGDTFPIVECAYPQDPAGPADQVINCACISAPVFESSDRSARTRIGPDRAKHHRETVAAVRGLQTALAKKVKAYFWSQRKRVLDAAERAS